MMTIKNRIKKGVKLILGKEKPGRSIENIFPSDIFIVSYPKSGNTWLKFLISNLMWPNVNHSFENINMTIPDIYNTSSSQIAKIKCPRIFKSHEYFDPRYKRVIYIVRDVRSVLVSYYFFMIRMEVIDKKYEIERFADKFFSGGLDNYGTWRENVLSWYSTRRHETNNFYFIKYEDLIEKPLLHAHAICKFLGVNRTKEEIYTAVETCSFESMRRMEDDAGEKWVGKKRKKKTGINFVRSGRMEEWKEFLSSDILMIVEEQCGDLMTMLDYK